MKSLNDYLSIPYMGISLEIGNDCQTLVENEFFRILSGMGYAKPYEDRVPYETYLDARLLAYTGAFVRLQRLAGQAIRELIVLKETP